MIEKFKFLNTSTFKKILYFWHIFPIFSKSSTAHKFVDPTVAPNQNGISPSAKSFSIHSSNYFRLIE